VFGQRLLVLDVCSFDTELERFFRSLDVRTLPNADGFAGVAWNMLLSY